nr:hypothetical protein Iba_chr07bCG9240 [Ipomoea batatas]
MVESLSIMVDNGRRSEELCCFFGVDALGEIPNLLTNSEDVKELEAPKSNTIKVGRECAGKIQVTTSQPLSWALLIMWSSPDWGSLSPIPVTGSGVDWLILLLPEPVPSRTPTDSVLVNFSLLRRSARAEALESGSRLNFEAAADHHYDVAASTTPATASPPPRLTPPKPLYSNQFPPRQYTHYVVRLQGECSAARSVLFAVDLVDVGGLGYSAF